MSPRLSRTCMAESPAGRAACPESIERGTLSSLALQAVRERGRRAFPEPWIRILYGTLCSPLGVKSRGQAVPPSRAFLAGQGLHCPVVDHYLARRPPTIRASAASCDPPHDGAV